MLGRIQGFLKKWKEPMRKIFLQLADDPERNPKSKEPKAILADLAFQDTAFQSIRMILMRLVVFWRTCKFFPLTWASSMLFGKSIRAH